MRNSGSRARRGATLIELLVALLLLDLALLSLATMSAVAARRIGNAGRRSRATVAAMDRVERIVAQPCGAATGGAIQLEPRVFESWTVLPLSGAVDVRDSVAIQPGRGTAVVIHTRAPC